MRLLFKTDRTLFYLLLFLGILPHLVYHFLFQTPIGQDFLLYQHRALLRSLTYLKMGYLPLWSPWMFSGMSSTFEHALSQLLSPLSWVYLLFSASFDGSLLKLILHYKLLMIGLGGCFAFLFFLEISKATFPSLVGAVIFMFNFRMLDNLRYSTPVEILAFLPLLLLFTEYSTRANRVRWIWIAYPTTLGITLLSGHPQHNIYNLILVILYFCFKLFLRFQTQRETAELGKDIGKSARSFFLMNVAGVSLSAPLTLPFLLDVMPFLGKRVEEAVQWNDMFRIQPLSLVMNFGFPWFADVHSGFYASMFTVVFGAFALFSLVRHKETFDPETRVFSYFFFAYFFLALLYALGSSLYVMPLINTVVPVLKSTRCPGRIMGSGIFCLAGAIVFGLKWFMQQTQQKPTQHLLRIFYGYLLGMTLFLVSLLIWVSTQSHSLSASHHFSFFMRNYTYFQQSVLERYTPLSIQPSPWMLLQQVISFWVIGALLYGVFRGLCSEKGRRVSCLVLLLLILLEARWYHSRGTWFLEQFPNSQTSEWFLAQEIYRQRKLPEFEYGDPLEGGKYPNYNAPQSLIEFLLLGDKEEKALYENLALGKLFVPNNYLIVSEITSALKLPLSNLRSLCLIEKSEIDRVGLNEVFALTKDSPVQYKAPFESDPKSPIRILEHTPNRLTFEISLKSPAVVNYLDGAHPGFVAIANGQSVPLLKTYGLFKGIFLLAGEHQVSIRYEPQSFLWGIRIAFFWLTLGVAFLGFFWIEQKILLKKSGKIGLFLFFWILSLTLAGFIEQGILGMTQKKGCFQYVPRSD